MTSVVIMSSLLPHMTSLAQNELFSYSNYDLYEGHKGEVRALAFDDERGLLASGGKDGVILVRDLTSKRIVQRLTGGGAITALAFRRDGKLLASGSEDKTVRLWDLSSGMPRVLKGHDGRVVTLAFSPSGDFLASGGEDRQVIVWSTESAQQAGRQSEHKKAVRNVFFNTDESIYYLHSALVP